MSWLATKNGTCLAAALAVVVALAPLAAEDEKAEMVAYVDMLGRKVSLKKDIERIGLVRTMDIYLQSAILGDQLDDKLVAVGTDFATGDADGYRKLSETLKLDKLVNLGSVYKDDGINVETVMGLDLDLIVVDKQFETRASVRKMVEAGLPVFFTDLNSDPFYSASKALRILGKVEGQEKKASQMADYCERKTDEVLKRVDRLIASGRKKPVIYIEQGNTDPSEASYSDGDVTTSWGLFWHRLGAVSISAGNGFQVLNPEKVLSANPDIIVIGGSNWSAAVNIMRLGFFATPKAASDHLGKYVKVRAGWDGLKAVKDKRLYAIYYNFHGRPYTFAGLEAAVQMLYPEAFADLSPSEDMADFFKKYMQVEYSGCFFAQWRP